MKINRTIFIPQVKYFLAIVSIFIFIYIFLAQIWHLVIPHSTYFDQYFFNPLRFRSLILCGFILALLSWFMALIEKKVYPISPLALSGVEKISLLTSSILLSIFFKSIFSSLGIWLYPIFLLIFFIFLLLLPQIINLYTNINYEDIKNEFNPFLKYFRRLINEKK